MSAIGSADLGVAFAFRIDETSVTNLTLGTSYEGTMAGNNQAQLFTVTLNSPTVLSINLADPNADDENEVYVSYGSPPTRDDYQYRYTNTGADQTLALAGQPGTYDILVYNNLVATPGSNYTLLAVGTPLTITGVTPVQLGSGQAATLLVSGVFPEAYQSATAYQIQFIAAGGSVYPSAPIYLSPTSLGISSGASASLNGTMNMSATLPANRLPAGSYSVRISDSQGNTQSLSNALTVTAGGTGVLRTSLSIANPIGNHEPAIIDVKYSNVGTAPLPAPVLVLTGTRGGQQGAFLSLDPSVAGFGYYENTTPAGFSQTVQFLASGADPGRPRARRERHGSGLLRRLARLPVETRPRSTSAVGELDTTNTQTIDWIHCEAGPSARLDQRCRLERHLSRSWPPISARPGASTSRRSTTTPPTSPASASRPPT